MPALHQQQEPKNCSKAPELVVPVLLALLNLKNMMSEFLH
jgi:hypothetical protein